MKYFQLLFLLLFLLPLNSFGQGKISQIRQANWDSEKEHWVFIRKENWKYDKKDREVFYEYKDQLISDYNPINNISKISIYNQAGQLVRVKEKGSGAGFSFVTNYGKVTDYTYDTQGELTEEFISEENTYDDELQVSFNKNTFEKIGNQIKFKSYYKTNPSEEWMIRQERDSTFNDNGCLVELTFTYFDGVGVITNNRKVISNYDDECNLLYREYNTVISSSPEPYSKQFFSYSDDKTISYDTLHKKNNVDEWNITYIKEIEKDSEDREIRYFYRKFTTSYTDTILSFRTYNQDGKIETYKKYQTRYGVTDEPLRPYQRDSFSYHYENGNLMLLEKFTRNYENAATLSTIEYEYYCDGQLKKEIYSFNSLHPSQLREYYYAGGVNCPLENTDPPLLLYPNPSSGTFMVHSNLLMAPDVTIQVFSILGQEVFTEKISQPTYQYEVTLPTEMKGQFLVIVSSDEKKFSEQIVIF